MRDIDVINSNDSTTHLAHHNEGDADLDTAPFDTAPFDTAPFGTAPFGSASFTFADAMRAQAVLGEDILNAEARLAESEERFRSLCDNAPVLIWTCDTQKMCNYFNAFWLRFTGRTFEQEVGMGWVEGVHPDDAERCAMAYHSAFDERVPFTLEVRLRRADGQYRWLLDTGVPRYTRTGEFTGYIGSCVDINEQKVVQEELRQSQERFKSTFEFAGVGMAMIGPDFRFLQVNNALCEFLGYTSDELCGAKAADFSHLDDANLHVEAARRLCADEIKSYQIEKRFLHKSGATRWALLDVSLVRDAEGAIAHSISQLQDISERKRVEDELRQSEARFKSTFELASVGMALIDSQKRLLDVNQAACDYLGYTRAELLGRSALDFSHPEDTHLHLEPSRRLWDGEVKSYRIEKRYLHKNGDIKWAVLNVSLVRDSQGAPLYSIAQLQDTTERKQAEAAVRAGEEQFRAFMENNPAISFIKDAEGRYVYLNKAVQTLVDEPVSALVGLTNFDRFPHELATRLAEHDREVLSSGESRQYLEIMPAGDGRDHHLLTTRFPLSNARGERLIAGVAIDVTDHREAEDRRQAASDGLRAVLEVADELLACADVDELTRRAVEMARERLGIERCSIFLTLPDNRMVGTWGTDLRGETTDERSQHYPPGKWGYWWVEKQPLPDRWRVVEDGSLFNWNGTFCETIGNGWRATTLIHSPRGPVGVFSNDCAISKAPLDPVKQEMIALYGSILGHLVERKRAEEALRSSEERFKSAFEYAAVGMALFSRDGQCLQSNAALRQFLGYSADELHRLGASEVSHPEDWARQAEQMQRLLRGEIPTFQLEKRYFHKEGHIVWGLVSMSASGDPETANGYLIAQVQDINERRRTEAERLGLLESERAARASAEASRALAEASRASAEEARGEAESLNRVKDEFLTTVSHELRTPLTPIMGWLALLRSSKLNDALRAEALESIERCTKAQARLVDDILDVSRVIRGKMRIDMRPVEIARVVQNAVDTVRPTAGAREIHLNTTLDNTTLDPEAGLIYGDEGRLQQVLWNLLSNAIRFTPHGGHIEVKLQRIASQHNGVVHNATNGAAPHMSTHARAQTPGDAARANVPSSVRITISDSGQGIAPAFLPHVFDSFRQADGSSTREHGGLGLGLAVVRHLVELHGGTARAESPGIGQGATFTIDLPAPIESLATRTNHAASHANNGISPNGTASTKTIAAETMSARDAAAVETKAAEEPAREAKAKVEVEVEASLELLRDARVLLVDDEPETRRMTSLVLSQYGCDVRACASAEEALEALAAWRADVLLSDIGMPTLDGYALLARVRALRPERGGTIPALALTAYASPEDGERALDSGFQKHLAKPFEPGHLASTVADLLHDTRL